MFCLNCHFVLHYFIFFNFVVQILVTFSIGLSILLEDIIFLKKFLLTSIFTCACRLYKNATFSNNTRSKLGGSERLLKLA